MLVTYEVTRNKFRRYYLSLIHGELSKVPEKTTNLRTVSYAMAAINICITQCLKYNVTKIRQKVSRLPIREKRETFLLRIKSNIR